MKYILCLLFPLIACAATPSQQLTDLLGNLQTMRANFVQVTSSKISAQQSTGWMALQRPGKFRWEIISPNKQSIITDGKSVWIYDADLEQATKQPLDYKNTSNPSVLLSGSVKKLQKDFIVTSPKANVFTLSPKQKNEMFQKVELKFTNKKLANMTIVDNFGQSSVITFSKIEVNNKIAADLFQFKAPAGVDVIGDSSASASKPDDCDAAGSSMCAIKLPPTDDE